MGIKPKVVDAIVDYVDVNLPPPAKWAEWPGGWSDEISTALIDAVYSARAVYITDAGRGIRSLVERWRESSDAKNSIRLLIQEIDSASGPEPWAERWMNKQHSPGRPADAKGGPFKSAAVYEAANILAEHAIENASDFAEDPGKAQRLIERVRGIGPATSSYTAMLLGTPGVKPDRMIRRFVNNALANRALEFSCTASGIRQAVTDAAERFPGKNETDLEHAIWAWQREH